jgi:TolB protein
LVWLSLVASAPLLAQDSVAKGVRLGLTYPAGTSPGIAILPVRGDHGDSVRAILQNDLDLGDRVTIVGQNAGDLPPVIGEPNLDLFAKLNVVGVVEATITADGLRVRVFDVSKKHPVQVMPGVSLPPFALSADWRMAIHRAADDVELWATGVHGISSTRVAFQRAGKLWTVDIDGENATMIPGSDGGLSPAWDPTGRLLAFNLSASVSAGVAVRDLTAGTTRRITPIAGSGSYGPPVFCPDRGTLLYSFIVDGSADLWAVDPAASNSHPKRVTVGRGSQINTSPSCSPDGSRIAFMSDRIGHPEVYISDADGSNTDLLTNLGFIGDQLQRSNPSWSPDGRLISYQSRTDGEFQIMTISPTGKNVNALTSASQNEDPSWAPDSRHLVFTSRRTGTDQLWVLDTESGRLRQLTRGSAAGKAGAWSPLLFKR